jgi:hypothetical protein
MVIIGLFVPACKAASRLELHGLDKSSIVMAEVC